MASDWIGTRIDYGTAGVPSSVQIEGLRQLRPSAELPQPSAMRGVEITGGIPSEEYVRLLRGKE